MEKTKVTMTSASLFLLVRPAFSIPGTGDQEEGLEQELTLCEEDREYLNELDIHESLGPDRRHPQVLRELASVIVRPVSIIFERSW